MPYEGQPAEWDPAPSAFRGLLGTDFKLTGEYAEVPPFPLYANQFYGTYTFALNFVGTGTDERIELEIIDYVLPTQPLDFVGANIIGSPFVQIADAGGNPL